MNLNTNANKKNSLRWKCEKKEWKAHTRKGTLCIFAKLQCICRKNAQVNCLRIQIHTISIQCLGKKRSQPLTYTNSTIQVLRDFFLFIWIFLLIFIVIQVFLYFAYMCKYSLVLCFTYRGFPIVVFGQFNWKGERNNRIKYISMEIHMNMKRETVWTRIVCGRSK